MSLMQSILNFGLLFELLVVMHLGQRPCSLPLTTSDGEELFDPIRLSLVFGTLVPSCEIIEQNRFGDLHQFVANISHCSANPNIARKLIAAILAKEPVEFLE